MERRSDLWVWGCVFPEIPGRMPDVDGKSYCSLETAASYLGAENVFYLNTMYRLDDLDERLMAPLENCTNVVCGLTAGDYPGSARRIGEFSRRRPNITGVILDDFLSPFSPSKNMRPEELAAIRRALKDANPDLSLYVVYYTQYDYHKLQPYAEHFDVVNLWAWESSVHHWNGEYPPYLQGLRQLLGKPVVQGVYHHQYGANHGTGEQTFPQPIDLLEVQCERITVELRQGGLAGWAILNNGWFSRLDHRRQTQWLKAYIDWHYGTTTAYAGAAYP